MQFDLHQCQRGDVAEVTLNVGANVRLLDSNNFNKYRRGQKHQYYGGLAKRSPTRLTVPRGGHWYVVVDLQGLRPTSVKADMRRLPAASLRPLPPIREPRGDIAEIARTLAEESDAPGRTYDVFISHASEDKDAVVRPLAGALAAHGVGVWVDEFELRIGGQPP